MNPERTRALRLFFFLLVITLNSAATAESSAPSAESLDGATKRYTVRTGKPYDDVLQDLEFAISQNNYRITGRSQIGNAIAESENIEFPRSTILHFCNLQAAREIYQLNPDFLLHMPCRVTLREENGSVVIEARLVPENDPEMKEVSLRINAMMRGIADYAGQ